MLSLIEFNQNHITGSVSIVLETTCCQHREERQRFQNIDSAKRYLNARLKKELAEQVQKHIRHCQIIFETGLRQYRTAAKEKALAQCLLLQHQLQFGELSLATMCAQVVQHQQALEQILPHPNNPSFPNSQTRLNAIICFAKNNQKQ
jgi:hypothetical protein